MLPGTTSTTSRWRACSARPPARGERPLFPLNLIGDYGGGGMLLAFGILCGVLESQRSGAVRWSTHRWSKARAARDDLTACGRAAPGPTSPARTGLTPAPTSTRSTRPRTGVTSRSGRSSPSSTRRCSGRSRSIRAMRPSGTGALAGAQGALRGDLPHALCGAVECRARALERVRDRRARARRSGCPPAQRRASCLRRARRRDQPAPAPRFSRTPGRISDRVTLSARDALAAWGLQPR